MAYHLELGVGCQQAADVPHVWYCHARGEVEGVVGQLDKVADAPVDLHVNTKLVARGEVVVVENRFGIKITELLTSL